MQNLIGKYVRITKLESLNEFSAQNDYTKSLAGENWWAEGFIEYFGEFIQILRVRNYNNPKGCLGFFYTSKIEKVEEQEKDGQTFSILTTQNSRYKVEEVEEFKIKYEVVKEN